MFNLLNRLCVAWWKRWELFHTINQFICLSIINLKIWNIEQIFTEWFNKIKKGEPQNVSHCEIIKFFILFWTFCLCCFCFRRIRFPFSWMSSYLFIYFLADFKFLIASKQWDGGAFLFFCIYFFDRDVILDCFYSLFKNVLLEIVVVLKT